MADDLARKNREYFKIDEVVWTPVPELGLKGLKPKPKVDAGADAGATEAEEEKSSSCGCRTVGESNPGGGALASAAFVLAAGVTRRRKRGPRL